MAAVQTVTKIDLESHHAGNDEDMASIAARIAAGLDVYPSVRHVSSGTSGSGWYACDAIGVEFIWVDASGDVDVHLQSRV